MENCEFRLLKTDELVKMYETDMRRDFPPNELKSLNVLLQLCEQGKYEPYALFRDGSLLSYAFYWSAGHPYRMLDYFAVVPEARNKGVGGNLLQEMLRRFCVNGRGVFGEVEVPDSGEKEVDALRRRRLGFYFRAGFLQRAFHTKIFGVHYHVLSYGPAISEQELIEVDRQIYRTVHSEAVYQKQIQIPYQPEGNA